jgi:aspartyl-tRNA(Asn)/glutamyl-tRNA(Gln) amidotransferase subunit A
MDQIGVISDSVAKTAQVAQVLAGHDPKDNTTWDEAAPEYSALMGKDLSGLTVGLANNYAKLGQNSAIWADLPAKLQAAGATVVAVELPDPALVNATFSIIASCEATSNFSRYDGLYYTHKSAEARTLLEKYSKSRGEGFGAEVKKQILLGNYYLTGANYQEYYMQALRQRTVIAQDFATALAKCAVVLTPTMVADATMPANSLTAGVNLAGAAAISVPVAGTNVQIISAPAAESQLFQVAAHIAGLN